MANGTDEKNTNNNLNQKLDESLQTIQQRVHRNRRLIRSLKAKADAKRSPSEKTADWMTLLFGSITFLAIHVVWFFAWITINLGFISHAEIFDPYPFGLLTMIVSLEAIFLTVFVLISQNRAARVDELRDEIDLQIDIIAEQELTKVMELLALFMEKNGIDLSHDKELQYMLKPTDTEKITKVLERQI